MMIIKIYPEHIVFRIVHYVRRERVERQNIGDFTLFLALHLFYFFNYVCVYDLFSWQEVVANFLLSEMELYQEFSTLD